MTDDPLDAPANMDTLREDGAIRVRLAGGYFYLRVAHGGRWIEIELPTEDAWALMAYLERQLRGKAA